MDGRCSASPQEYEPPASLWRQIESYCSSHELHEVKNLLGESLVEQSLELHQEVEALLDIWRDYRQETMCQPAPARLPEPPAQREMLKAEIKFFVNSIHEKAKNHGRDPNSILSRHNSQILDYVLDEKGRGRQSSASSRLSGRETPLLLSSRASSALTNSCDLSLSDIRATLEGSQGVLQFDKVAEHLRDVLETEIADLISSIEFLQECLEDEVEFRCESRAGREPSLADLRKERKQLEAELHSPDYLVPSVLRDLDHGDRESPDFLIDDLNISKVSPTHRTRPAAASASSSSSRELAQIKHISSASRDRATKPPADKQSRRSNTIRRSSLSSTAITEKSGSMSSHKLPSSADLTSPAIRRLLNDPSPEHVTIRTAAATRPPAQVVHLASIPIDAVARCPVPPSATRPPQLPPQRSIAARPGSAQRFRNMVLDCRDGK